jgi:phosphoribosylglycinamide formyltransferase 1
LLKPKKVIYDGNRKDVLKNLSGIFDKDFIHFNENVKYYNKNKIHTATSRFLHYTLDKESVDFLLCFGNRILEKELIDSYPDKLINFHPSILPSFRGLKAIDQALDFGAAFLGNTAHFIDTGIDTGKIIIQSAMLTDEYEDYEDVLEMQFPMIKMILRDILNYKEISQTDINKELKNRKKKIFMPEKCII